MANPQDNESDAADGGRGPSQGRGELLLGHVGRPRGLRGEVLLRLFHPDSPLIREGQELVLRRPGGAPELRVVRVCHRGRRGWSVRFSGLRDRDAAEALCGACVLVRWDALPPLESEEEFYYEELRGFTVVAADGTRVGEVAGLFATNVDMLVVRDGAREVLIPVLDGFVTRIDRAARRIEVDPPEGLLELE